MKKNLPLLILTATSLGGSFIAYMLHRWGEFHLAAVIAFALTLGLLSKTYGAFSLPSLIVFATGLYALSPTVDIYIWAGPRFDPDEIALPTLLSVIFVASYGFFCQRNRQSLDGRHAAWGSKKLPLYAANGIIILVLCAVAYIYAIIHTYGTIRPSISRAELFYNKGSLIQLTKLSMPVFISIYALLRADRARIAEVAIILTISVAYLYMEFVVFGDRRLATGVLLTFGLIAARRRGGFLLVVPAAVVAAIALISVGFSRNSDREFQFVPERALNFSNLEFGYPAEIVQNVEPVSLQEWRPRWTLLEVPGQVLPRFISPTRSPSPALQYVAQYYPDVSAAGGAFGYHLVFEWYENLFLFGPIILGYLFSVGTRVAMHAGDLRSLSARIIMIFTGVFGVRYDTTSFVKQSLVLIVLVLFFVTAGRLRVFDEARRGVSRGQA